MLSAQTINAAFQRQNGVSAMYEIIIWGALFIIFVIAESVSAQLVSIWFAAGSLVSLIVSLFTDSILIQLTAFVVVSVLLLIFTRPILRKFILKKHEATNADAFIQKEGIVLEAIDNIRNTGRIKADGLSWAAQSETGIIIPENTKIIIVRIQGVTAFVKPLDEPTA